MDFVPIAVFTTLIVKIVDVLNGVKEKRWDDVYKQATAWFAGIVTTFLFAQTQFASAIEVWEGTLADLGTPELLVVGLAVTSLASVVHDTIKAIRV